MRHSLSVFASTAALLLVGGVHPLVAQGVQEEPGTDWMVVTYYRCDLGTVDDLNDVVQDDLGPVADEMIEEGHITEWGLLNHGWGDLWNFNVYYVAPDIEEFMPFWYEFMETIEERSPGWLELIQEHCHDHKDTIYRRVMSSDSPVP